MPARVRVVSKSCQHGNDMCGAKNPMLSALGCMEPPALAFGAAS